MEPLNAAAPTAASSGSPGPESGRATPVPSGTGVPTGVPPPGDGTAAAPPPGARSPEGGPPATGRAGRSPGAPPPTAVTLACRSCGGPLAVRAPGHSVVVVCPACGSLLDARDPDLRLIAEHHARTRELAPRIPLGSRGRVRGELYEVIGYLVRQSSVEGEVFSWAEYLLFNPFQGFRWLAEYRGHWVLTRAAAGLPRRRADDTVEYLGATFRHFQTAEARIQHVLGEFPWQVRVGDTATVEDYIDPPRLLTCERTPEETTWSVGEHVDPDVVWKAFALPGEPPRRAGVGAVQPSPYAGQVGRLWRLFLGFAGAAVAVHLLLVLAVAQNRLVYEATFEHGPGQPAARVTPVFELAGRPSNVVVELATDLANRWAYFHLALIQEETGRAWNVGRAVEYYFGRDAEGSWTEGSPGDRVYLPGVPAGRYYLLVEPESDAPRLRYTVRVRRDVPRALYLGLALGVLAVPPLFGTYRAWRFEYQRWSESDHPWIQSTSDANED